MDKQAEKETVFKSDEDRRAYFIGAFMAMISYVIIQSGLFYIFISSLAALYSHRIHRPSANLHFPLSFFLMGLAVMVLAAFLSVLSERYRINRVQTGEVIEKYAPLLRRGLADGIDSLLISIPIIIICFYVFKIPQIYQNFGLDFEFVPIILIHALRDYFLLILGFIVYAAMSRLVLVYLEGRYGVTPGKLLMGLRVVRADNHKYCGFIKAFLRRFCMILDAQIGWIIAIASISVSDKRQRLGDILAETVVLEQIKEDSKKQV